MTSAARSPDTADNATGLKVAGWLLVVAAFALAAWGGSYAGNAYMAGRKIGEATAYWLLMEFVSWLITRNSTPSRRAIGRLVVGAVLMLGVAASIGSSITEKKTGQKFFRDALAMGAVHDQKFEELGARFDKVDLSDVLETPNLTSPEGIARSRAKIAQFRALVLERSKLQKEIVAQGTQLVDALPDSRIKDGARIGVTNKNKQSTEVFGDLEHSQLAQMATIDKILDWCAAQGSRISNEGGTLTFSTQQQSDELQPLLDQLTKDEALTDKAVAAAGKMDEKTENDRVKALKMAAELLK